MSAIYFVMHLKEDRLMSEQRDGCIDRYLIKQAHQMFMMTLYGGYTGDHLKSHFNFTICLKYFKTNC